MKWSICFKFVCLFVCLEKLIVHIKVYDSYSLNLPLCMTKKKKCFKACDRPKNMTINTAGYLPQQKYQVWFCHNLCPVSKNIENFIFGYKTKINNSTEFNKFDVQWKITLFTPLIEHIQAWEWVSALTLMVTLSLQIILYLIAETL